MNRPTRLQSKRRGLRIAYVSYDGIHEPLGKSQVMPYLRGLAELGHTFELLSFEKRPHRVHFRKPVGPRIHWTALRDHRKPRDPLTALDLGQGLTALSILAGLQRADLVHVRSYAPAIFAYPFVRWTRRPLLFDVRGLWPEECVEDGLCGPRGAFYSAAKGIERQLLIGASAISVVTNSARRYLRYELSYSRKITAPISVIPTCTDLKRFHPDVERHESIARALGETTALAYVGSLGPRYLPEQMAEFYLAFRSHVFAPRFLVLSREQPTKIRTVLERAGVCHELIHRNVPHHDVPAFLVSSRAAVSFHPSAFVRRGGAPTKVGEMLGAGLPVATSTVGDLPLILSTAKVGVVLQRFDPQSVAKGAKALAHLVHEDDIKRRAHFAAKRWFSLEHAVMAYDEIYKRLAIRAVAGPDQAWPR